MIDNDADSATLLAKGSVPLSDVLLPTSAQRASLRADVTLEVVTLPRETEEAIREACTAKVMSDDGDGGAAAAAAGGKGGPSKAPAKGKAAAVETPPVAKEPTPEQAAAIETEVKQARKSRVASAALSIQVDVAVLFGGVASLASSAAADAAAV
jgi:hypothetical protein